MLVFLYFQHKCLSVSIYKPYLINGMESGASVCLFLGQNWSQIKSESDYGKASEEIKGIRVDKVHLNSWTTLVIRAKFKDVFGQT